MKDTSDRYYCTHCERFFYGNNLNDLARTINGHNDRLHPAEFSGWTGNNIVKSSHYHGSAEISRVTAETPSQRTTQRDDQNQDALPSLTDDDKQFLAKALVKW